MQQDYFYNALKDLSIRMKNALGKLLCTDCDYYASWVRKIVDNDIKDWWADYAGDNANLVNHNLFAKALENIEILETHQEKIVEYIKKMLSFWILQLDEGTNELRLTTLVSDILEGGSQWKEEFVKDIFSMPYGMGSSGFATRNRTFLCMPDSFADEKGAVALEDHIFRNYSHMAIPLYDENGYLICFVAMFFPVPRVWCDENHGKNCLDGQKIDKIENDNWCNLGTLFYNEVKLIQHRFDAERRAFIRGTYIEGFKNLVQIGELQSLKNRDNNKWWNTVTNFLIFNSKTKIQSNLDTDEKKISEISQLDPFGLNFISVFVDDDKDSLKGILAKFDPRRFEVFVERVYKSICATISFFSENELASHNINTWLPCKYDENCGENRIDLWLRNFYAATGISGYYYIPLDSEKIGFVAIGCVAENRDVLNYVNSEVLEDFAKLIKWIRDHLNDAKVEQVYRKVGKSFEKLVSDMLIESLLPQKDRLSFAGIEETMPLIASLNSLLIKDYESELQELWSNFVTSGHMIKNSLARVRDLIVNSNIFLSYWEPKYLLTNFPSVYLISEDLVAKNRVMTEFFGPSFDAIQRLVNKAVAKNYYFPKPISLSESISFGTSPQGETVEEYVAISQLGFEWLEIFQGKNKKDVYSICHSGQPQLFEKYQPEINTALSENTEKTFKLLGELGRNIETNYILASWDLQNRPIPISIAFNHEYLNKKLDQDFSNLSIHSSSDKIIDVKNPVSSGLGAKLYGEKFEITPATSQSYIDLAFHINGQNGYNLIDAIGINHVRVLLLKDREDRDEKVIGVINLGSAYFNPDNITACQFRKPDLNRLLDGYRQFCSAQLINVITNEIFEADLYAYMHANAHELRNDLAPVGYFFGSLKDYKIIDEVVCREAYEGLSEQYKTAVSCLGDAGEEISFVISLCKGIPEERKELDIEDYVKGFIRNRYDYLKISDSYKGFTSNKFTFGKTCLKRILKVLLDNISKHGDESQPIHLMFEYDVKGDRNTFRIIQENVIDYEKRNKNKVQKRTGGAGIKVVLNKILSVNFPGTFNGKSNFDIDKTETPDNKFRIIVSMSWDSNTQDLSQKHDSR